LFTSDRHWWQGRSRFFDLPAKDIFPRDAGFKAGRATFLTIGDGMVTGLARGGRRGSASDYDHNITFDQIVEIRPLPLRQLELAVNSRSRPSAARVMARGFGVLTEAASEDVRDWIERHHPDVSTLLEEILSSEPGWMVQPSDLAAQYRQQRDAVNVALEIAGFDRQQALKGVDLPNAPEHFHLDMPVSVQEDSTIGDDLEVFPGWERVHQLRPQGRVYEDMSSGRRLTVLLANKNPIERSVGVDLLYHVHDYKSFVLVQYKRVRREGGRFVVRLDDQLDVEIKRMADLESALADKARAVASVNDERLTPSTCFFKLSESDQPGEITDLSRGRYVSLASWRLMENAGLMVGPRGGRSLDYEKVKRYHSNSSFAELVSEGWVGSVASQYDELLDMVFADYHAGRSLVLAALRLGRTYRRIPLANQQLRIHSV
jgi:hypothetical protein